MTLILVKLTVANVIFYFKMIIFFAFIIYLLFLTVFTNKLFYQVSRIFLKLVKPYRL